jgi:trk system potassium uptake protein TrkH
MLAGPRVAARMSVPRPIRRLQAARLIGTAVVGTLGMIMANTPQGHFGPTSEITTLGIVYAASLFALATLFSVGALLGRRWPNWGIPLLLSLNIGVYLPALIHDLTIAGGVIFWNLRLLAQHLMADDVALMRSRRTAENRGAPEFRWMQGYGDAAMHILLVSLLANVSVLGFEVADSLFADLLCLALGVGVAAVTGPFVATIVRHHPRTALALALPLLLAPWSDGPLAGGTIALALYQALVFGFVLVRGPVFGDLVQSFIKSPAVLILSSFAALAVFGALLLSFPAASQHAPLSFLDALFTATSASCITGLSVIDVSQELTAFGQGVLVALIQLGGLGIMVLSTFATVILGGRLALRSEQALEEMLDLNSPRAAYELARFIVVSTFTLEAIAAGILALRFSQMGFPLDEALWRGVFHAVSAFCHAGFSLWSTSLVPFRHDSLVLTTHMALIVVGGLGFPVLAALWLRARGATRRFSLQTKIVLWMTLALTVAGALLYALLEWDATLHGLTPGDKLINATFQSITLRSAGYNSVDMGPVGPATVAVMLIWMFIGAAPGGTGGGIKVTTLAVMLAAIPALLRNQSRATLLGRAIPHEIVYRAATIVTVAAFVTGTATILILATHTLAFEKVAFEVISAVCTVGLSLGITADLQPIGKWVLIVLMFVGRVGPTSLALALGSQKTGHVTFPEGRIMVG